MGLRGPIPRTDFCRFAKAKGWEPFGFARHGQKWKKAGARRSVIVPHKREIYPTIVRDSLDTMGETEEALLSFLGCRFSLPLTPRFSQPWPPGVPSCPAAVS